MNKKLEKITCLEYNNKVILIDRKNKNLISFKSGIYDLNEKNLLLITEQFNKRYINTDKNILHTVYFMVTDSCNLNCPFCSAKVKSGEVEELDLNFIRENIIPKLKELEVKNIVISGGEPLLLSNISILIQLLKEELKVNITLQTNGILINEELISQLEGNVDFIDFSVQYYFLKQKNSLRLEKILKLLKKITPDIGISFVIDTENKNFAYKILDLVIKYDTYISLKFIDPIGRAKENDIRILSGEEKIFIYGEILDYIIKNNYYNEKVLKLFTTRICFRESCGACKNIFSLKPNGDMYVCYSLMDCDFYIDNINKSSAKDIIKRFNHNEFNSSIIDLFDTKGLGKCDNCKILNICQGFCAANKYYNNGEKIDCMLIKLLLGYNAFYYDINKSIKENLLYLKKCIENKIYLDF